ncbi:MAG: DUF1573 domain-containing protein [Bacteroidetes bacterium]|nr:DUF1573 domain-containing protein [Bacteroidota bacterium]
MKKLVITGALALAFFANYNAQEKVAPKESTPAVAVNPNAAELKFEKETHDYGTIKQGADGNCEFKFKNTGKEPLIISNAQGSCGCTVPIWPKEPIKPGESSTIKVHYDTKRVGAISKSVTITSNAKNSPAVIKIKGLVEAAPAEEPFPTKKTDNGATPFEKTTTGFN